VRAITSFEAIALQRSYFTNFIIRRLHISKLAGSVNYFLSLVNYFQQVTEKIRLWCLLFLRCSPHDSPGIPMPEFVCGPAACRSSSFHRNFRTKWAKFARCSATLFFEPPKRLLPQSFGATKSSECAGLPALSEEDVKGEGFGQNWEAAVCCRTPGHPSSATTMRHWPRRPRSQGK
jgi:hypothetical protein